MPIKPSAFVLLFALPLFMPLRPARAQTLTGAIDIHAHSDPDGIPRSIDAIDLAKLAKSRGMRAIVLKNHYEPTASLAYIVRKDIPNSGWHPLTVPRILWLNTAVLIASSFTLPPFTCPSIAGRRCCLRCSLGMEPRSPIV